MNQDFIRRLNEAFDYASMADVARRLGIPHATVRNYYLGRLPAADVLVKIANETNVSLNWLLAGRGDKYAGQLPPIGIGRFIEERIAAIIDDRLAALGFTGVRELGTVDAPVDFDLESAVAQLGDPQSVMAEWFRFEGRESPSDYGIIFFNGWEAFSTDQKIAAVRDAKRAVDKTLGK